MIAVNFKVTGFEAVKGNIRQHFHRMGQGVERGLVQAAEFLKEESNRIAPLLEGHMIAESFVIANPAGFNTVVYMGYGPFGLKSAPYTLLQHETEKFKHAPGRTYKFLEIPFEKNTNQMLQIIVEEVRRAL